MLRILIAFVLVCGVAMGGEIEVKKGDETSLDQYFEFYFDGSDIVVDGLNIDARVKNVGPHPITGAKVAFTVKDSEGNFIGRDMAGATPSNTEPGGVSFIKGRVILNKKIPAVIEWSISSGLVKDW